MEDKEKIEKTLLKVALGFKVAEVTEEYAEVDGAWKLTKRKVAKKDVPPDLKAVQLLLAESGDDYQSLSDEELQREKLRLLSELSEAEKKAIGWKEETGQVCVEKRRSTAKKQDEAIAKPKRRTVKNGE